MQTCPEHCLILVSWSSFLVWNHWAMFMIGSWWCHQMEFFSALLALCGGHTLVTSEFPSQRPVTRNFDIFFDLRPNKRLSKESWGWRFGAPSHWLWRYCNVNWSADLYGSGLFPEMKFIYGMGAQFSIAVAQWRHKATYSTVNIGSGNYLNRCRPISKRPWHSFERKFNH